MSLDVSLTTKSEVYSGNITHNLGKLAGECGLYYPLWRPEEISIKKAGELIPFLNAGLHLLKTHGEKFRQYEPENGWGTIYNLIEFTEAYLKACKENPDAEIGVYR